MAETESYITKSNPSAEDWLAFNKEYFAHLKGETSDGSVDYAPFVDVDLYASEAGLSVEEYFERINEQVGVLGRAALQLVHSEMDDAWHIVVAPEAATN